MLRQFATDLIEFFGSKWVFGALLILTLGGMIYSFSDPKALPPILFFGGIWYTRLLWLTLFLSALVIFSKGVLAFSKNIVQRGFGQALYIFWTSIPLAIALITGLVLIGLLSTLIPQLTFNREVDLISRYGQENFDFIKSIGLLEIFSAPYTYILVAFFVLNLSACTYKRLQASIRYFKMPIAPKRAEALELMPEYTRLAIAERDPDALLAKLSEFLKSRGFRTREEGEQLVAEKLRWERFAIDIFHISLLIAIGALFVTNEFGYGFVQINYKDDLFSVPERTYQVRVDDFWSENYQESERVMDWKTELTFVDGEEEKRSCTIEVNRPCTYQGVSFYQAAMGEDWLGGASITFLVAKPEQNSSGEEGLVAVGEYRALLGESIEIAEEGIRIKFGAFLPDFALLDGRTAFTRTQRLLNPAAYFEVSQIRGGSGGFSTWAFRDAGALQLQVDSPYRFFLLGMTAKSFTGLELSWDPGTPVAYAAFSIIVLMLIGHVFLNHQMIWISLDSSKNLVHMGGRCRKGEFTEKFDSIVQSIESKLGLQVMPMEPASISETELMSVGKGDEA